MTPAPVTPEELRTVDLFDTLDDAELARWIAVGEVRELEAGTVIAEQDETAQAFTLLLTGTARALIVEGDRTDVGGDHVAPTWIGAIPVLTQMPFAVRMVARTDVRLMSVAPADFLDIVFEQRPVLRRIVGQVRPVVSRMNAAEQNRERLASLGTMAAGLAHELNNPAAAARRAAASLAEALVVLDTTMERFVESGIERDDAARLIAMKQEAMAGAAEHGPRDTLAAADAEDDLADLLDGLGIAEPWRFAEPLAAAGVDEDWVRRVLAISGRAAAEGVLSWIATSLSAQGIAAELTESTQRMSELVGAVKTYAYMDRGEVVDVDVHEGLDTTLVVLGHKLKTTHIAVAREYDRTLPKLAVHGSELNQVWTNLLDNAIGALGDAGTITVRTERDGDCAVIEIEDDGPGIPADVLPRIFEPFFTTKDVGQGTGLGLDTVRRIVTERHRGSIVAESEAGPPRRTVFRVRLPLTDTIG